MTSPAAARGREVRQRLLAAAVELIPERGWAAVSTRVLAKRAGVTPSVVHYHFHSLRDLLNEAVVGVMGGVMAQVDSLLDSAESPAALVDATLASVDRYAGADPVTLLGVEAYLAATRDDSLRDQLTGLVEDYRQRVGRWLGEQGVPSPEDTAAVLLAAVDGLLLHRGVGASTNTGAMAGVLRRLVRQGPREERI